MSATAPNNAAALPAVGSIRLLEARRRYANARRRARYWSGTPNFNTALRSNETRSSDLDLKYELAMCDCKSWEHTIGVLTGKQPEHYNPKKAFALRFSKMMMKASNGKPSCGGKAI